MAVKRYLRIILQFWKSALIQAMEYRASFAFSMLANATDFTFGLIQYGLFFTVAKTVAGWEMPQMLAFYAVFMTLFSLHFIFLFPNLDEIGKLVNTGHLDLLLVKPFSAQAILSFRRISFEEFGSLATAQVLLFGLWYTGNLVLTPLRVLGFLVAMLTSLTLIYALFLGLMALAIRLEKLENTGELLWSIFGLCRYPVDVFPRPVRWLFLGLLPFGFVTTVPARALTMGENPLVIACGLVLSFLFLMLARLFWRGALVGYSSAGG